MLVAIAILCHKANARIALNLTKFIELVVKFSD